MSTAERRITSKSCVASSSGRTVQTHALAPETSGAAKLVPSPSRPALPIAVAIGMPTPGADEVDERASGSRTPRSRFALLLAPTVRTWGMLAG